MNSSTDVYIPYYENDSSNIPKVAIIPQEDAALFLSKCLNRLLEVMEMEKDDDRNDSEPLTFSRGEVDEDRIWITIDHPDTGSLYEMYNLPTEVLLSDDNFNKWKEENEAKKQKYVLEHKKYERERKLAEFHRLRKELGL